MTYGQDEVEIERRFELRERIYACGHIVERLGPAASTPQTPILDIPGRQAMLRKIDAQLCHESTARQYPPWTTTTTGCDRSPAGRKSSATWLGSEP